VPVEWETGEIIRRVDVEGDWSGTGTLVAIISKNFFGFSAMYLLGF